MKTAEIHTVKVRLKVKGVDNSVVFDMPIFPMDKETAIFQREDYNSYKHIETLQDKACAKAFEQLGFEKISLECFSAGRFEVINNKIGGIIDTWQSKHKSIDIKLISNKRSLLFDCELV